MLYVNCVIKGPFTIENTILYKCQCFRKAYIDFSFALQLGDNCIQNFHLGRYIVGYTVRNLVLRRCASGAMKSDLRMYSEPL